MKCCHLVYIFYAYSLFVIKTFVIFDICDICNKLVYADITNIFHIFENVSLICLISFSQFYCLEGNLGPLPKSEFLVTIVNKWKPLSINYYLKESHLRRARVAECKEKLLCLQIKREITKAQYFKKDFVIILRGFSIFSE